VEFYSSINDFQKEFIEAKKTYPDVDFKVRVEKKARLLLLHLSIPQSNLETKIELLFGDDQTYFLENPINTYIRRLRLQHLEYLSFCENGEKEKKEREEKRLLELEKARIKSAKESIALNYRQQQQQKAVIERLSLIAPKVYSSSGELGETVLGSWSMGDGEYSMDLSLIRICDELSVKDTFDLILEEKSLNYGEYAPTDSSYDEEILLHERYDDLELAIKRCENIIIDKCLFS